jgi:hypothetical protein
MRTDGQNLPIMRPFPLFRVKNASYLNNGHKFAHDMVFYTGKGKVDPALN